MFLLAPAPILAPPTELVLVTLPALLSILSLYILDLGFWTLLILELNPPPAELEFTLTEDFYRLSVYPWEETELVLRFLVELCFRFEPT